FLTKFFKSLQQYPSFTWATIRKSDNKIEVLIFVTEKFFKLILCLFPITKNVSQCFRYPHTPDTGIVFGLFQNNPGRSEEHTSELQSRFDLVCRLLLEKKKKSSRIRHRLQIQQGTPSADWMTEDTLS